MSLNLVPVQKVILCGEFGVGKTSIFRRFATGKFTFETDRYSTIGLDYFNKVFEFDKKSVKLQLWDTGGMERVATVTSSYYKFAEAAILVFAFDNPPSFHILSQYLLDIVSNAENAKIFLCGNKRDLCNDSQMNINDCEINTFREQCHNIISGIYKISCKSNEGVEDMFNDISRILLNANVQKLDMQSIELPGGFQLNGANSRVDADNQYGYSDVGLDEKQTIYKGQCGPGKCGEEAACQPFSNDSHTCICPHDYSHPTSDLKCPNRATVPLTPRPIHNIIPPSEINVTDNNLTHPVLQSEPSQNYSSGIFKNPVSMITLFGVLCSITLFILTLYCYWKRCKNRKVPKQIHHSTLQKMASLHSLQKTSIVPEIWKENPNYSVYSNSVPLIHRNRLKFQQEIGEGCFGKVFKGEYSNKASDCIETVAIKVLKETASRETEEDFMREVEIMSSFKHRNILSLLGVVVRESNHLRPIMVFEYMTYGDLAEFLRDDKHVEHTTHQTLLSMAIQIASGMKYLAVQRFIHRDLACRNCLVTEGFVVKIADFGMSRDVYTCDYYKMGGSRLLPVRWMSPESVVYGKFTFESDIWSFGVVLWEMYSLGKQPYYGHTNEQVLKLIMDGVRLEPPAKCPEFAVELMQNCWKNEPKERLKFAGILKYLLCIRNSNEDDIIDKNDDGDDYDFNYLPRPPSFSISVLDGSTFKEANKKIGSLGYLVPNEIQQTSHYFQPMI